MNVTSSVRDAVPMQVQGRSLFTLGQGRDRPEGRIWIQFINRHTTPDVHFLTSHAIHSSHPRTGRSSDPKSSFVGSLKGRMEDSKRRVQG